jgi:hypothetical protein
MKQPSYRQMLKRCPATSNKLKSSDVIISASARYGLKEKYLKRAKLCLRWSKPHSGGRALVVAILSRRAHLMGFRPATWKGSPFAAWQWERKEEWCFST